MLEPENYECVSRVEVMENEGFTQSRLHRDAKFFLISGRLTESTSLQISAPSPFKLVIELDSFLSDFLIITTSFSRIFI